jgi:DHA3 family multidrug efflux protein-like MFS transporter
VVGTLAFFTKSYRKLTDLYAHAPEQRIEGQDDDAGQQPDGRDAGGSDAGSADAGSADTDGTDDDGTGAGARGGRTADAPPIVPGASQL